MTVNGTFFYHQHLRRLISAVGQAFAYMRVVRFDASGNLAQVVAVPLINRLGDPELRRSIIQSADDGSLATKGIPTYPRMGYQLSTPRYAAGRQRATLSRTVTSIPGNFSSVNVVQEPVPWDFSFQLIGVAKTSSDIYQLVEQILPMFNPTLTIVMNDDPMIGQHFDMKCRLTGLSITDSGDRPPQEGGREVVFEITFVCEYHLYGPAGTALEEQVLTALNGGVDMRSSATRPRVNEVVIDTYIDPENFYADGEQAMSYIYNTVQGIQQPLAIVEPGENLEIEGSTAIGTGSTAGITHTP